MFLLFVIYEGGNVKMEVNVESLEELKKKNCFKTQTKN